MSDVATNAITALSDAFRNRDIEGALACFADDPGTTYAGSERGEIAVGPEALRELFERIFDRDESYSWTADHVWSSARGDLHMVMAELAGTVHSNAGTADCFPYRLSGVLRVENDASQWLLLHGAEPTTFNSRAGMTTIGPSVLAAQGTVLRRSGSIACRVSDQGRPSAAMPQGLPRRNGDATNIMISCQVHLLSSSSSEADRPMGRHGLGG